MNKILFILFLYSTLGLGQEINIQYNGDTIAFNSLNKEDYLIENNPCQLNKLPSALYFTSYKEFSEYYSKHNLEVSGSCHSVFNNFNFKKYNMVLLNFNYSKNVTKSITVESKYESGKYYFLVRRQLNDIQTDLLMEGGFSKCMYLPKEKSKQKPEVLYCIIPNNN